MSLMPSLTASSTFKLIQVDEWNLSFFESVYRDVVPWAVYSHVSTGFSCADTVTSGSNVWRVWAQVTDDVQIAPSLIGIAGLCNLNFIDRSAEVVVGICKELRKGGHGEAMSKALIDFAFTTVNLRRLYSVVLEDAQSIPLLKKFGFKHEGTMKQARYRNGRFVDTMAYGLIRDEVM